MFISIFLTLLAVLAAVVFLKTFFIGIGYLAFARWCEFLTAACISLLFGGVASLFVYIAWCR